MDLKRKVRGVPLLLIIAIVALLTVGAVAQVVKGGWFFDLTDPDGGPADGHVVDTITITERIEFLELNATITGTGEVDTEHTITYTIKNIGHLTLSSGYYYMGFTLLDAEGDPIGLEDIILSAEPIGSLLPDATKTGSTTWTPIAITDYKTSFRVGNIVWSTP